jgi:hypothetical protein
MQIKTLCSLIFECSLWQFNFFFKGSTNSLMMQLDLFLIAVPFSFQFSALIQRHYACISDLRISVSFSLFFWLLLYAHRHQTILGVAGHILTPANQLMVMGLKIWSLSNPGFEPVTFRLLASGQTRFSTALPLYHSCSSWKSARRGTLHESVFDGCLDTSSGPQICSIIYLSSPPDLHLHKIWGKLSLLTASPRRPYILCKEKKVLPRRFFFFTTFLVLFLSS